MNPNFKPDLEFQKALKNTIDEVFKDFLVDGGIRYSVWQSLQCSKLHKYKFIQEKVKYE